MGKFLALPLGPRHALFLGTIVNVIEEAYQHRQ